MGQRRVKGSLGKYINGRWGKGSWDRYKVEFPDAPKMCEKYAVAISKNSGAHMKRPEYRMARSIKILGENNINHKSKTTKEERQHRSPFSKTFVSYSKDEEVAKKEVSSFAKKAIKNRLGVTQYEYWLKVANGDEKLASKLYKERQTTFTIDKLRQKYGEEEALRRWTERQEKWKKKVFCDDVWIGQGRSKVSDEFCDKVIEHLGITSFEKEKHIRYEKTRAFKYDLRIDNLIIEFNGDYYHCNPKIEPYSNPSYFNKVKKKTSSEIWKDDEKKNTLATSKGFYVHIVWESEWKDDPNACLEKIKMIYERVNHSSSLVTV
jgi:hypothetical protein